MKNEWKIKKEKEEKSINQKFRDYPQFLFF